MLGKLLGAFIGRKVDQRDGEGGTAGTVIGAATPGLIRRAAPVALAIGGLVVAKKLIDRARGKRRAAASPPSDAA